MKALRSTPSTEPVEPPLPYLDAPVDRHLWVEVTEEEDGKCVRAMLIANGIVPMACQEKGREAKKDVRENTKRLADFLKKRGKKLVLREPYVPVKPRPNITSD
jgi:hypothetical protein